MSRENTYQKAKWLRHWNICESDVGDINALMVSGFGSPVDGLSFERLQTFMRGPTAIFAVRMRNDTSHGQIVSMASLCLMVTLRGFVGHVVHVATHSDHRRHGLARAVMVELLQKADRTPMKHVTLTCSPKLAAARVLYKSLGFSSITDLTQSSFVRDESDDPETTLFKRDHPNYQYVLQRMSKAA